MLTTDWREYQQIKLSEPPIRREYANMKQRLISLSQRYVAALRAHLQLGSHAGLEPTLALGRQAVVLGLETLGLARMHEQALGVLLPEHAARTHSAMTRRAGIFFAEALAPIAETHRAARQNKINSLRLAETLNQRTLELAATNRQLKRGIRRHKQVETALIKSGVHYTKLLKDSLQLQKGLRQLTHQVLAAQEQERKKISLELQDEVAQTLLGINVRLLNLKQEARTNSKGLKQEIASTQRLVAQSAKSVGKYNQELKHPQ
jgi:signal transduction histidine kinase